MKSPPPITGPVPVSPIALNFAEERTRRMAAVRNSWKQTLDPNVRKTQSFFPCLEPLLNIIRFRLGLSFKPASPLQKNELANLAIYNHFKNFERDIRKGVFASNPQHFAAIDLSHAEAKSLHGKFNRELDRGLAESFARTLLKTRKDYPEVGFSEAVCKAYASIYLSVADKLKTDRRSYPRGYIDTAGVQLEEIVAKLKPAITPPEEASEPAPASPPASEPIAREASTPATGDGPAVYLSEKECNDLATEQFAFFQEAIARSEEKFEPSADIDKWPQHAVDAFNQIGLEAVDKLLRNLSPGKVSTKDLHTAYIHGMQMAETAAIGDGVSSEEFGLDGVQEFRGILRDIRNDIHSELGKHEDSRIRDLFRA